jgi:hypothetical protein
MRDFSDNMQQMRDFSCQNQGREPGRKKNKCQKLNIKNANLISHPFSIWGKELVMNHCSFGFFGPQFSIKNHIPQVCLL